MSRDADGLFCISNIIGIHGLANNLNDAGSSLPDKVLLSFQMGYSVGLVPAWHRAVTHVFPGTFY
jgi:hypothetical protein